MSPVIFIFYFISVSQRRKVLGGHGVDTILGSIYLKSSHHVHMCIYFAGWDEEDHL